MGEFNNLILDKAHIGIIGLRSVKSFLTETQVSEFIEKITEELKDDNESNLYEFTIQNNLENFKISLKKHFQFMIDRTENSIDFDAAYRCRDIQNNFAYCAFYKKLLLTVEEMENSDGKKYMRHYCNYFLKKYTCKKDIRYFYEKFLKIFSFNKDKKFKV